MPLKDKLIAVSKLTIISVFFDRLFRVWTAAEGVIGVHYKKTGRGFRRCGNWSGLGTLVPSAPSGCFADCGWP